MLARADSLPRGDYAYEVKWDGFPVWGFPFTRNEGVPGSSPGVGSHEASQKPRSCLAKLRSPEENRCVRGAT